MDMNNDALRALRAPIEDRIDLRHRVMDALVDRGGKLRAVTMLAAMVDRIDDLVWVDGDLRATRLRYEIFNTCLRKDVNLADKTPSEDPKNKSDDSQADLLDSLAEMLMARGTGRGAGLGVDRGFVDVGTGGRPVEIGDLMRRMVDLNDKMMVVLQKMADPAMIVGMSESAIMEAMKGRKPGEVAYVDLKTGQPLTDDEIAARDKKAQTPGTPGATDRDKSKSKS